MTKFDLLAIISVLTNKSERLVLIMRKNGLMIAGMIIILVASVVLALASLIALATARVTYLGQGQSIRPIAESELSTVRIIMGCIAAVALISFAWAFISRKRGLILGVVISAIVAFYCTGCFAGELAGGSLVETSSVSLAFMAMAGIALLVGTILRLVGVIKMNRQLSE